MSAARDYRVLLVNMPFAGITYPSLALGLFKAQLREADIHCDVADLNVRFAQMVGWESYGAVQVSSAALAGEQMFADELFAGHLPDYREYEADILPRVDPVSRRQLRHMKAHVPAFLDGCLEALPWESYDLVGFSTVFEQNLPSLSLACRLKQQYPDMTIVFGGANCEDVMGATLHRCFPFVDIVCKGEASVTFPELARRLRHGHPIEDLPGIVYRSGDESVDTGAPQKLLDMDSLPYPDYDDYFRTLELTGARFNASVAIETARGCWWGEKAMCTFCGLNGQGIAFRAKSPERALAELLHLVRRHPVGFVRAVDNMMPPSYFESFLPRLAEENPGVDVFYEVRPNLGKEEIALLARARVRTVQVGLENLSTNVLRIMRKGTTALRNLEFLRWCRAAGVDPDWNILFGFPGERDEDYDRALELARLATHLKAPSSVGRMRLDRFSPNFERAAELGFSNIRPWSLFRYVYPFDRDTLMDLVYYFDYDNECEVEERARFAELYHHVSRWQAGGESMIALREDGAILVRDGRAIAPAPEVRLEGARALAYEYCDARRQPGAVRDWLAGQGVTLAEEEVKQLLDGLVAARLMAEEKGQYLSLAVFTDPVAGAVDRRAGIPRALDVAC